MNFTPAEFRALVKEHQGRVQNVAYGLVRNTEDAREIAQEAFLRVHLHVEDFDGRAAFSTWLYRIVVNLSIDHLRKSKAQFVEIDESIECERHSQPDVALHEKQTVSRFEAALAKLPVEHRDIFVGREVEERSYLELAELQGIPLGTVMSRLHHARKKLQGILMEAA